MPAKKKTSKKKTGKELALPWQQKLAKHAKEGKAPKEKAVTGDVISIKGSKFSMGGVKIGLDGKGRELDCFIVAYAMEKVVYDTDYVEGETSAPVCFAIGYDEDELAPHKDAVKARNSTCEGCPSNEWGSGRGDGKECSDRRRLALCFEDSDGKMGLKIMSIPPTSLKNWKSFINDLDAQGLHPMQCAVRLGFDEDSTATNPPVTFELVKEISNEKQLGKLADMLEPATKLLEHPYDPKNYKKGNGKKKSGKKKTDKKKRSKMS